MKIKRNYKKVPDRLKSSKNMWLTILMMNRKIVKIIDCKKLKLSIKMLNKMVLLRKGKSKSKMDLKCLKIKSFQKIVITFLRARNKLLFLLFKQKILIRNKKAQ
jgi:hypothetical protein